MAWVNPSRALKTISLDSSFAKYGLYQMLNFLQIWSHILKKSLMQNFIFCAMFSAMF